LKSIISLFPTFNILKLFFSRGIVLIANLLLTFLLVRYLGVAAKGAFSFFTNEVLFFFMFLQIIGGNSLIYLTQKFNSATLLAYFYSFILFFLILIDVPLLVFHQISIEVLVGAICMAVFYTHLNLVVSREKYETYSILQALPSLIFLGIVLVNVFIINNLSVDYFIHFWVLVYFLMSILVVIFLKIKNVLQFKFSFKELLEILTIGFSNQVSHLLNSLYMRVLFYFVAYTFTANELGNFSIAISIIEAMLLLGQSYSLHFFTQTIHQKISVINAFKKLKNSVLQVVLISIFLVGFVYFIPNSIFIYLLGNAALPALAYAKILVFGLVFSNVFFLVSSFLNSYGKFWWVNFCLILQLFLLLIFYVFHFFLSFSMFDFCYYLTISPVFLVIFSSIGLLMFLKKENQILNF